MKPTDRGGRVCEEKKGPILCHIGVEEEKFAVLDLYLVTTVVSNSLFPVFPSYGHSGNVVMIHLTRISTHKSAAEEIRCTLQGPSELAFKVVLGGGSLLCKVRLSSCLLRRGAGAERNCEGNHRGGCVGEHSISSARTSVYGRVGIN